LYKVFAVKNVLPIDCSVLPIDRSFLPIDRSVLPTDRSVLPLDRSVLPTDRSVLPLDRSVLPTDRPQHNHCQHLLLLQRATHRLEETAAGWRDKERFLQVI